MTKETNIQHQIMLAASEADYTIWRNNIGKGWVAPPARTVVAHKGMHTVLCKGDVVLRSPYWLTWGLTPGSSDLIGIKPTIITPDMVGQTVAIFTAFEVKTAKGKPTQKQTSFLKHVLALGGIARIVRSPTDIPLTYMETHHES